MSGAGNAAVGDHSINLVINNITCGSGAAGSLHMAQLTIDATNHFSGTGDIMGQAITLSGNIQQAYDATKGWRFRAIFHTVDGNGGILIGIN